MGSNPIAQPLARMSKLVKETDLKSVGIYSLEGSIPSSRIYASHGEIGSTRKIQVLVLERMCEFDSH